MSACGLEGGSPVLDVHFELVDHRQRLFESLDVPLLRLIGQPDGLGECLIYKIFREDSIHFAAVANDEGVEPYLDDLQLGSFRIDGGGHSGCVGLISVEW